MVVALQLRPQYGGDVVAKTAVWGLLRSAGCCIVVTLQCRLNPFCIGYM